ncbi:ATP-binding protein [Corynebacterium aquilae]|uniref:ATP-binding protein n=1 Tax=Corynebacterium aquilae DSM 44791 TaxID=1431546 RepID=A0A1L7CDY3_9CORY|nr:ATP-binding protein [Corynebacterium aquilae]APT83993.1 hypothetical protein CAQU_01675 [Corynebacterium aquilae DSM 44791]
MNTITTAPTTATPLPGQYRLAQLDVANWGTFDGLHHIPIARKGFLISGGSGSGKSTLIDALTAVITPPNRQSFNSASGDKGRSLISYCRGAWKRVHASDIDEVTNSYLRTGGTFSAIAVRYDNGLGQTISAVRMMFLTASCMNASAITNLFFITPGAVDLQQLKKLANSKNRAATAKKILPQLLHVGPSHTKFLTSLRSHIGIPDEQALNLLHYTQAAKQLSDLNELMRTFMLPEPDTLKTAADAVAQFEELHSAYLSVTAAKKQIEKLTPIRQADLTIAEFNAQAKQLTQDATALERVVLEITETSLQTQLDDCTSQRNALEHKLSTLRDAIAHVNKNRTLIQHQLDGRADAELPKLTAEHDNATKELARVQQAADTFSHLLQQLQALYPTNEDSFRELLAQIATTQKDIDQELNRKQKQRKDLYTTEGVAQLNLKAARDELEAVRKTGSALDSRLTHARSIICRHTGLHSHDLPFIAELIYIDEEHAHWQPAAEKLLASLGRTMIVPDEHYTTVAKAINDNNLRTRLSYRRLTRRHEHAHPHPFEPNTIASLITVEPGRWHAYLQAQLSERFNYRLVTSVEEFTTTDKAITQQGQIKHSATRHEKDDRALSNDRSRWVLSKNSDTKIEALTALISKLTKEYDTAHANSEAIDQQFSQLNTQKNICHRLLETTAYADIDVESARLRVTQLQQALEELSQQDPDTARLNRQLADLDAQAHAHDQQRSSLDQQLGAMRTTIDNTQKQLENVSVRLQHIPPIPTDTRTRLNERINRHTRRAHINNIEEVRNAVSKDIDADLKAANETVNKAEGKAIGAMAEFRTTWPERTGDFASGLDGRGDFLALLDKLERDDLPRFEDKFVELLRNQTQDNISRLLTQIRQAPGRIREELTPVNDGLRQVYFDKGTHLQIHVKDSLPQQARQFIDQLRTAVDGLLIDETAEDAEKRFLVLKDIIDKLQVSDKNPARLLKLRLDTRLHVSFLGVEIDDEGHEGAVYDSSAGLSGGQAQKLVFFCLAAALRYQLTGAGVATARARRGRLELEGTVYPAYGTVVLDEAFALSDTNFTRYVLSVFTAFGFHMILATPEKMLQTLQDYIGGLAVIRCPDRQRSDVTLLPVERLSSLTNDDTATASERNSAAHDEEVPQLPAKPAQSGQQELFEVENS